MYSENQVKEMVQQVLTEMLAEQGVDKRGSEKNVPMAQPPHTAEFSARAIPPQPTAGYEEGVIDDITAAPLQEQFFVPHPADREGYLAMKKFTPARLGVWRAGPRYNTVSMLRFRADHATAQDSVFSDVDPAYVEKSGWVGGQSQCADRDEYVTRPDKGRLLDSETRARYEKELQKNAKVLIMVGDGLSSAAIAANAGDIIPAIRQGLQAQGIEAGPVPFVRFCRVGAMDDIGELTGAEVVCCLIGERPGLVTSESMSAYIAYRPTVGMAESRRTVVSNIHRGGTPAVEAGAHIAGLLGRILKEKVSGVELSL